MNRTLRAPQSVSRPPSCARSWRRPALLLLAAALLAPGDASAGPIPFPPEADTLLTQARRQLWAGDEESAVPLFRRYLDARPSDDAARLDLARALAWSGSYIEAIRAYETIGPEAATRAEALSGMASVYAWSGRAADARRAARAAVEAGGSEPELLELFLRLEEAAGPRAEASAQRYTDSDALRADHQVLRIAPGESASLGLTAMVLREELGATVRTPSDPAGATGLSNSAGASEPGRSLSSGGGVAAGLAGAFPHGWRMEALVGGTRFDDAPWRLWAEAEGQYRSLGGWSLTLQWSHRDRGYDLGSLAARRAGITGHEMSVSSYRSFPGDIGMYGRLRGGRLSDANRFASADLSVDRALFDSDRVWLPGTHIVVGAYAIDYRDHPSTYYAASREWNATTELRATLLRAGRFEAAVGASAGPTGNETGRGRAAGADAGLAWALAPTLELGVDWSYDETLQASTYIYRTAALSVRWAP